MSNQPEFIWARLDNATLYADGSSPCVARTKEFANGTKYVRADASQPELNAALETIEVLRRSEAAVAARYIGAHAEIERLRELLALLVKNNFKGVTGAAAREAWMAARAALSGSKE